MPVEKVHTGCYPYYQWGTYGKKYYYIANNKRSRELAKAKALCQGRAIKRDFNNDT